MAVEILVTNEGKLDCHSCDDKLKEERGHDREGIIPFLVDGKRIFRCRLTILTPLSYEYLKAFNFYEKAILPNGKGWNEENNKFIQAMMLLGNEFNKWQNKELKEKKRV